MVQEENGNQFITPKKRHLESFFNMYFVKKQKVTIFGHILQLNVPVP